MCVFIDRCRYIWSNDVIIKVPEPKSQKPHKHMCMHFYICQIYYMNFGSILLSGAQDLLLALHSWITSLNVQGDLNWVRHVQGKCPICYTIFLENCHMSGYLWMKVACINQIKIAFYNFFLCSLILSLVI